MVVRLISEMSTFSFDVYSEDCSVIDKALQSPALSSPKSRLVVLSCHDVGPQDIPCLQGDRNSSEIYSKLVVGHLSAHRKDTHPNDFGLPPWPLKVVELNQTQKDDIRTCRACSRDLLFSFSGRRRKPFRAFHKYFERRHGREGIYAVFHNDDYENTTKNMWGWSMLESSGPLKQADDMYYQLLIRSNFMGAPLGDCLYSLRFAEALSAGAIPVVFSDGWVLPYNMDVVDWSELAVLLPQRQVRETLDVLLNIPIEKRCEMRRKGFNFFQRYLAHSSGRLRAVLEIVDKSLVTSIPTTFSFAPE
jgi:Exostosin family